MNTPSFQKPIIRARISVSGARAAYMGPSLNLSPHRNGTAIVAIALEAPFELERFGASVPLQGVSIEHVALIEAGTQHHLRASGEMVFVYLDALGDDFLQLRSLDRSSLRARLLQPPAQTLWTLNADQWCDLLGVQARNIADTRMAEVVRAIDQNPLVFAHLADAAVGVGLSPSRFQSLFRQSVGMPFRRYRVWRRMAVVLRVVSEGETLTTAAFEAGFSSSAHLSSTFRAMFGLTLSSLISLGSSIEFS